MVHMLLSMDNMHGILRQLYTDMMTLCEGMLSLFLWRKSISRILRLYLCGVWK